MEQTANILCPYSFTLASSRIDESDATLCDINRTASSRESSTGLVKQTVAGFDQEHKETNLS